jgi:hypothetical protein
MTQHKNVIKFGTIIVAYYKLSHSVEYLVLFSIYSLPSVADGENQTLNL